MERNLEETIVLKTFEKVDSAWLDKHPNLRILGSPTTGEDHLDREALSRRGVKFVSLKGERKFLNRVSSTSEHALGLIIALMRNYKKALQTPSPPRSDLMGHKLRGKTAGIIGHKGRIGTHLTKYLKALGMRIRGYDTVGPSWWPDWTGSLDRLLSESDVVSIHVPLMGNEGWFTRKMFGKMKKTAFIVNTSRPGIFEKGALLEALEGKVISGAALDFTDDPELVRYAETHPNLILTNHIGGFTKDDRELTDAFIAEKVKRML